METLIHAKSKTHGSFVPIAPFEFESFELLCGEKRATDLFQLEVLSEG